MISLSKIVSPCLKPFAYCCGDGGEGQDRLLWCQDLGRQDLGRHAAGEFSMAAVQANSLMEDISQIESGPLSSDCSGFGPNGTFVGIYDGHCGPETALYVGENLFPHLKRFTSEQQDMSKDAIRKAFLATEEGFLSVVRKQFLIKPQLAAVGSCCLVGVICGGILYIANAGDSRAVLGRFERGIREVNAVQLSTDHNVCHKTVRDELRSLHPDDSKIVVLKHQVWRVKGIIQVSRAIGDAYLKLTEFNRKPLLARFRLREPFYKSILNAEPSIVTHKLCPQDQFVIFASDGLWEHLSNQDAVEIVQNHPHNGIAMRLIKIALQEAARKREMRYSDLRKIDRGIRRHFHDDITVVVLFLDPTLICNNFNHGPLVSLKGCGVPVQSKLRP